MIYRRLYHRVRLHHEFFSGSQLAFLAQQIDMYRKMDAPYGYAFDLNGDLVIDGLTWDEVFTAGQYLRSELGKLEPMWSID